MQEATDIDERQPMSAEHDSFGDEMSFKQSDKNKYSDAPGERLLC